LEIANDVNSITTINYIQKIALDRNYET